LEKIQVSLKYQFSSKREMFQTKLQRRSKHRFYAQNIFPENLAVYEIMWKNMVEPDWPKTTIECGVEKMQFACWITKARIQTNTRNC
jgi:hypothetical protein